jgi:hypothetical protein
MNYSIPIKFSKQFMMKLHAHPLVADVRGSSFDDPSYQAMWVKQPDTVDFNFSGWNRNQFKNSLEAKGFNQSFKDLLERSNIDLNHLGPLLYISTFQYQDFEKQSLVNNNFNCYRDSGTFLLDLYIKGSEHFEKMLKDSKYHTIYDEQTDEIFFSLLDPAMYDDLDDHYSTGAVLYQSFKIGKSVIRIPDSYHLSLFDREKNRAPVADIPPTFTRGILDAAITKLIKDHEEQETEYFQIFNEESHNLNQLKTITKQKKKLVSGDVTIVKIGSVIQDYLSANYVAMPKARITDFLWEYFALLKAYDVKADDVPPTEYSELTSFYREHKITKESIRLKFKSVDITGYF